MSASSVSFWQRASRYIRHGIWQAEQVTDNTWRGWIGAGLRVVATTWNVFLETGAATRAASLTFSSMLGMGPLVVIAVLVAGFALGDSTNPDLIAEKLQEMLTFVAPQVATLEAAQQGDGSVINNDVVNMLNGFITGAQNSTGFFAVLPLVVIVLLLFKSIEDTFNHIWGVRSGRSISDRVVYYWAILTLGALLFFASITLLSASALFSVFEERLPFGAELVSVLKWSLPLLSLLLLVGLLTVFYRAIPHTRVLWRAAFAGAVVVTLLLALNNYVALFYTKRVISTKNLYGSAALPLVIMLGMYIFWLYLLFGAILSYAVQNVHFRSSQTAWDQLSASMKERLSLVVLLTICRRFRACLPPITASELGAKMKIPAQILNESLARLVDLNLLSALSPESRRNSTDKLYQPAVPLDRITLHRFRTLFEHQGDEPAGETLEGLDPVARRYQERYQALATEDAELLSKPLDLLFAEIPEARAAAGK